LQDTWVWLLGALIVGIGLVVGWLVVRPRRQIVAPAAMSPWALGRKRRRR
jgi:hypothetical protein